eukprot:s302_g4.t1
MQGHGVLSVDLHRFRVVASPLAFSEVFVQVVKDLRLAHETWIHQARLDVHIGDGKAKKSRSCEVSGWGLTYVEFQLWLHIQDVLGRNAWKATAIHKLAKTRRNQDVPHETVTEDPRWLVLTSQVVENGTAFIWPMRLLALVSWAVASLRDRRITSLLFDIAAKRVSFGSVPQDLSSLAWAVATARARDTAAQTLLRQISTESVKSVQSFIPQDLAMCAWAFAKVAMRDGQLLRMFADEALEKYAEMNGQNVSNLVWSLATIRENHEPLMNAVSRTRAETIQGLAQQEFSNIVWSFATLLRTSEMLFRRTAPRVVEAARELDSQHLANIAWAFAKISHRDDGLFYVLSREAMEPERRCSPLNLANLAREKSIQALWTVIRPGYMVALFLLGWAANVSLFARYRVDYASVLHLSKEELVSPRLLVFFALLIAAVLSMARAAAFLHGASPELIVFVLVCYAAALLAVWGMLPRSLAKHSRWREPFVQALWRCAWPDTSKEIPFIEVLVADGLTSLAKLFFDITMGSCIVASSHFDTAAQVQYLGQHDLVGLA